MHKMQKSILAAMILFGLITCELHLYAAETATAVSTLQDKDKRQQYLSGRKNEDNTYTITLYVNQKMNTFDFGIAYCLSELSVLRDMTGTEKIEWNEEFQKKFGSQGGVLVREVKEKYIVFGGMIDRKKEFEYAGAIVAITFESRKNTGDIKLALMNQSADFYYDAYDAGREIDLTFAEENGAIMYELHQLSKQQATVTPAPIPAIFSSAVPKVIVTENSKVISSSTSSAIPKVTEMPTQTPATSLTVTPALKPTQKPALAEEYKRGDADNSGKVDLSDANIVLKAALEIVTLTGSKREAADADHNSKIDLSDANSVLKDVLENVELL